MLKHSIAGRWRSQIVWRKVLDSGRLVLPRPFAHLLEMSALVSCVEVDEWLRRLRIPPDLPENADVDSAHELLAQYVEAVRLIS